MEKLYSPDDVLMTEVDHHWADDTLIVKRTQDVEPILEQNKRLFDVDDKRFGGESFYRMASIPMVVVEQWMAEGIDVFKEEDMPKVRAKLNSSEYRFLRTKPGKI
jgi:hypothetical protein